MKAVENRQRRRWVRLFASAALTFAMPAHASDLEDLAKAGFAVVATTNVAGSFDGCDFDRVIVFEDGLLFKCRTYHYHYAYHPEVFVLKNQYGALAVIIDGEAYEGTLYRR